MFADIRFGAGHRNVHGTVVAEGRRRSSEGDTASRKQLVYEAASWGMNGKFHAAEKFCTRRHDVMMIVSEKWRETLRKAESHFEANVPMSHGENSHATLNNEHAQSLNTRRVQVFNNHILTQNLYYIITITQYPGT